MIDLSKFYTSSKRAGEDSMSSLPSGIQIFAGTPFDVRGVVQLSDGNGASGRFPKEVRNIVVNRICRRLHFLHATATQSSDDDQEVSRYIIHYADHRSLTIINLYGQNLRSWWTSPHEPLYAARAALVWMGTNRQTEYADAQSLRMFKYTWENPWPETEITSIDFVSRGARVEPFLVALTAD